MKIISHRGNLNGSNSNTENTIKQIDLAISSGFEVEIDVWVVKNKIYLGHDKPDNKVSYKFFTSRQKSLWIHCKNLDAFSFFQKRNEGFNSYNYFWHETDKLTLTSLGIPWCYPGTFISNGITVNCGPDWKSLIVERPDILGICTDYPQQ